LRDRAARQYGKSQRRDRSQIENVATIHDVPPLSSNAVVRAFDRSRLTTLLSGDARRGIVAAA
jgi:hypothetical protein